MPKPMPIVGSRSTQLARFEEALASYDRALALKLARCGETWSNRGNALLALARFDDALASYDRAIALDPDHADAHHNRKHPSPA